MEYKKNKSNKKKISIETYEDKIKYRKKDNLKYKIWGDISFCCPFCSKILNLATIEQHTRGAHCKKISKILFKDENTVETIKEKLKNTVYLIKHGNNNNFDKSFFKENEINYIIETQEKIKNFLDNNMEHTTDRRTKHQPEEQEPEPEPEKQRKINNYGFYEIDI